MTVTVAPASATTVVGGTVTAGTFQFTATVAGPSTANQGVTWTVSPSVGASISTTTGLFTASAPGTFTVTATSTFAPTVSGTATLTVKPLDLNGDGTVDLQDLLFFAQYDGTKNTTCDLNGDGTVDDKDLAILLRGL